MAFDADFLKGVLEKDDVSIEQKVQSIVAEHEASERGLVQKRDELLGAEKKYKEKIKAFEDGENSYKKDIEDLKAKLDAGGGDKAKEYYESQLAIRQKEFDEKYNALLEKASFFQNSHYERLKRDAIEEGIKDIQFIDGLKDGFISRVLVKNHFEPKEIDGKTMFLDENNKTIPEAFKDFASTAEGKAYIKAGTNGGGSKGSGSSTGNSKTMTVAEFQKLNLENPELAFKFRKEGGRLV